MTEWSVPLCDVRVEDEDIAAVVDAYRSGWLSLGPRTRRLEAEFAEYTGARHAVAVTSGTAALHLICAAAGVGPGDEVIVPSLTFVATVNAVIYTGATPVFADIAGPTRPWISASAVEAAITNRTKAVMAMSYGGHPGDVLDLSRITSGRQLVLLEDAAHAAGTRLENRHLGTLGVAGAFSLFANKNLAVGEGGMVITDDAALADRVRRLRSHGMTSLSWDRSRRAAGSYDVVEVGFNYRIDEPRAALGRKRLTRLDRDNERRRVLDARYRQGLGDLPEVTPALPPCNDAQLSHHLFPVVLDPDLDRDVFRLALAKRGIETSVHYTPVHRFGKYAEAFPAELPLTDEYAMRTLTLPMFAHMAEDQHAQVIDAVRAAAHSSRADETRTGPRE